MTFMDEVSRQDDEHRRRQARFDANVTENLATIAEFRSALRVAGDPGTRTLPVMEVQVVTRKVPVRKAGLLRPAKWERRVSHEPHAVKQYEGWELLPPGSAITDYGTLYDLELRYLTYASSDIVLLVDGTLAVFSSANLSGPDFYVSYTFANTPSISLEQDKRVVTGAAVKPGLGFLRPEAFRSHLATYLRSLRPHA
ncbi:hypothetical protein ACIO3S_06520 [Nocardioides sp. NPDC087217]|uniref:hypothetical protein n=1 Tax=Nocardioides sp. NPDC087217 TaxID=3364335 RepID=UPI00380A2CDB